MKEGVWGCSGKDACRRSLKSNETARIFEDVYAAGAKDIFMYSISRTRRNGTDSPIKWKLPKRNRTSTKVCARKKRAGKEGNWHSGGSQQKESG